MAGETIPEVAAALNQIYNHRWQPMEWEKTRTSFTQFDALDMLVIQEPALPEGKRLEGWVRIFPPDEAWVDDLKLPEAVALPRKGAVYIKNEREEEVRASRETWKSLAGQGGMPPAEWMHFLVGEGFCR